MALIFGLTAGALASLPYAWLGACRVFARKEARNAGGASRTSSDVSLAEIRPLLERFDRSSPLEQAFSALLFQAWSKDLGRSLLMEASDALESRIHRAEALDQAVRTRAGKLFAVYHSFIKRFEGSGPSVAGSDGVSELKRALDELQGEERRVVRQAMRDLLFEGQEARMDFGAWWELKYFRLLSDDNKVFEDKAEAYLKDGIGSRWQRFWHRDHLEGHPRRVRDILNMLAPKDRLGMMVRLRSLILKARSHATKCLIAWLKISNASFGTGISSRPRRHLHLLR